MKASWTGHFNFSFPTPQSTPKLQTLDPHLIRENSPFQRKHCLGMKCFKNQLYRRCHNTYTQSAISRERLQPTFSYSCLFTIYWDPNPIRFAWT